MSRFLIAAPLAVVMAGILLFVTVPLASSALPEIRGKVGPGSEISVTPQRVDRGTYRFVVNDKSSMHNWHITGPGGVDKKTSIRGTGVKTFELTLRRDSTYKVVCDMHPDTMRTRLKTN